MDAAWLGWSFLADSPTMAPAPPGTGPAQIRGGVTHVQDDEKRSVWTGLVALLAVGLVVGVIAGGAAFFGARFLGLDETTTAGGSEGPGASLEMPNPTRSESPSGPLVTLPGGDATTGSEEPSPSESESESEEPESEIALQSGQSDVAAGQQIDLTGVYPGGEGRTLTVQRQVDGEWLPFGDPPVTMTVSGETFSTYVVTSQTGETNFRVVDDEGEESNEVTVTIG